MADLQAVETEPTVIPYGQQLPSLHTRIAAHATAADLDHLMFCIRGGSEEGIARMADAIGIGSPPEEPEDDEFVERAPTRAEVLAYAAEMGEVYRNGSHGRGLRTPDELIDDLSVQPVRGEAYDLIRSGHEDAALALLLAHEGYRGDVAFEAVAQLAVTLRGYDVAFVPLAQPFPDAVRRLDPDERLLARHGDETVFGSVSREFGDRSFLRTGNALISLDSMRQLWRQVPVSGDEHRGHLTGLLSGLADAQGHLRPGLTVEDVVAALTGGNR